MPLADFYVDYMKNRLEPGEFVQGLEVPLPDAARAGEQFAAYKISKRFDSDISAVSAGLRVRLDAAGTVRDMRMAARSNICGLLLALAAAVAALATDYKPLTDMRASAAYRAQVAGNLLRRFWLQTRPGAPLAESAVSVFARPAGAAAPSATASA